MGKDRGKKAAAVPANTTAAVADAETLAKTPVTLGVVLALGTTLAGGMAYVAKTANDLQSEVAVFKERTALQLEHIQKDLDRLAAAKDDAGDAKKK